MDSSNPLSAPPLRSFDSHLLRLWLPQRPQDCHKGDFGCVGVLGGAPGMAGGALLAARGALRLGAGRVYAGLLDERVPWDPMAPEIMVTAPDATLALPKPACLVAGPGLGTGEAAHAWLGQALGVAHPLLLDADALNLLALDTDLADRVGRRPHPTLLTPHPGEAGRLLGISTGQVQADRRAALAALVDRFGCGVVLKGAGTLIGWPDSAPWLNPTGNPGMAAPGMGDVLAGMVGALVAQGLDMEQAGVAAVWLHGAAADSLAAAGQGPVGLAAGELPTAARQLLNRLLAG